MVPPSCPIAAHTYTAHGYPWFELYTKTKRDRALSEILGAVNSVHEIGLERTGNDVSPKPTFEFDTGQVMELRPEDGAAGVDGEVVCPPIM